MFYKKWLTEPAGATHPKAHRMIARASDSWSQNPGKGWVPWRPLR